MDMQTSASTTLKLSAEDQILRRTPLVNHKNPNAPTPPGVQLSECKFTFDPFLPNGKRHPYAHLLTPKLPLAGKREERLMFNLQDVLSETEWPPIPSTSQAMKPIPTESDTSIEGESAPDSSSSNRDGGEDSCPNLTIRTRTPWLVELEPNLAGRPFEPTVTINTKEAMESVFGMFNSPEKTRNLAAARIKSVEIIEPLHSLMSPADANAGLQTPGGCEYHFRVL